MEDSTPKATVVRFGDAVRLLRIARAMFRETLAKHIGVDPSHITLIENGRRSLHRRRLARMAGALQVELEFLECLLTGDPPRTDSRRIHELTEALRGLVEIEAEFKRGLAALVALLDSRPRDK